MPRPLLALALTALATAAVAQSSVAWTIDETIVRDQSSLFWTSPTAIETGLDAYLFDYEITKIEADARFIVTTVTVDVTDLVGGSIDLVGSGEAPSLPAVVFDQRLDDPDTGTAADIFIEVDADGFGQARFTNVMLGDVDTPFGSLPIEAIRVEAEINLLGLAGGDPADYTGEGAVDRADYQRWVAEYGTSGPGVTADGNGDQLVDAADYTVWRDRFDSPLDATTVPEPTAAALLLAAAAAAFTRRA